MHSEIPVVLLCCQTLEPRSVTNWKTREHTLLHVLMTVALAFLCLDSVIVVYDDMMMVVLLLLLLFIFTVLSLLFSCFVQALLCIAKMLICMCACVYVLY